MFDKGTGAEVRNVHSTYYAHKIQIKQCSQSSDCNVEKAGCGLACEASTVCSGSEDDL